MPKAANASSVRPAAVLVRKPSAPLQTSQSTTQGLDGHEELVARFLAIVWGAATFLMIDAVRFLVHYGRNGAAGRAFFTQSLLVSYYASSQFAYRLPTVLFRQICSSPKCAACAAELGFSSRKKCGRCSTLLWARMPETTLGRGRPRQAL